MDASLRIAHRMNILRKPMRPMRLAIDPFPSIAKERLNYENSRSSHSNVA